MTPRRLARVVGAILLLGWLGSGAASTSSAAEAEDWSYQLWNELMSPYCPGRTLLDCPSGQAGELRTWIQEQARSGRSRAEVEEELYGRFGDVILQAPKASGLGIAAYVIPVVAFLAGGAIVLLFLRRQTREPEVAVAHAVASDPELERLVDEELER